MGVFSLVLGKMASAKHGDLVSKRRVSIQVISDLM